MTSETVEQPSIKRRYAKFTPDPRLLPGLRQPFPDALRFPIDQFAEDGVTVMIVTDRISRFDIDRGRIFSGEEGGVYDNIIDYAISRVDPDVRVREVILWAWPISWIHESQRSEPTSFRVYLEHFVRAIDQIQPDAVVLAGIEMAEYIFQRFRTDDPYVVLNRLTHLNINGRQQAVVPTLDLFRLCTFDPDKTIKQFANLIGFFIQGFLTACNGRNRYTIPNFKQTIHVIDTMAKFDAFFELLKKSETPSIDCETGGKGRKYNVVYSIQFSFDGTTAYFLPVDHFESPFTPPEKKAIKLRLRNYFERGTSRYHIYQGGKFDIGQFIAQLGVRYYNHRVFDITAGEYGLDENRKLLDNFHITKPRSGYEKYSPYSLNMMAEERGCTVYRYTAFSKGDRGAVGQEGLTERFIEYGCYDVTVTYRIAKSQIAEARRRGYKNYMKFVAEQMSDTVIVFANIETVGLKIDKRYLMSLLDRQGPVVKVIKETMAEFKKSAAARMVNSFFLKRAKLPTKNLFGQEEWIFSLSKREHAQTLFFKELGLEPITQTKDGGGKIDKVFRAKYKNVFEVELAETLAKITTLYNNFIKPIAKTLEEEWDAIRDGCIRASYWFTEVVTSRSSSSKPNFQNIPQHGKLAKLIKRLFIARAGRLGVENDYSAHEVRDWANQAADEILASSFYTGMLLRQQMRFFAYQYPDYVEMWTARKKEIGWNDKESPMKKSENRLEFIGKINDPVLKKLAKFDYEIDAKGDIHRQNYQHFFGVDVLQVTDEQRQSVKAVVFGTIYGKTPPGLAESLNISVEEAQNLQDTLFTKFGQGGDWIKEKHAFGREHLYIETPVGMHRHLWGYLHNRNSVLNAMDRRGPNSSIQGTSSNIGIASMRLTQKLIWHYFIKQGLYFPHDCQNNYVHDSAKSEVDIHLIPIYLYLVEHASTTLIHKRFREVFGYKLKVGLELEFQLAAAGDRAEKWNFMEDNLMYLIDKEIDWQNKELDYGVDKDKYMKLVKHNWDVIKPIRQRELYLASKSKEPSEIMLLKPQMVSGLGLMLNPPQQFHDTENLAIQREQAFHE